MTLKNKGEREILSGYLNNSTGEAESDEAIAIMAAGESNQDLRRMLEEDWNTFAHGEADQGVNLSPLLDRIHHQIRLNEHYEVRKPVVRFMTLYSKIAAAIMIPLLAGTGFLLLRDRTSTEGIRPATSIYAPAGSRVSFVLPDGTEGMLNSGSTIAYSMPFSKKRSVVLTGEAWFEVAPDPKHPFTIDAGDLDLSVLGTTFNVSAYPEEDYTEIVLESGKVLVSCGNYKDGMVMSPSERLVYENGKVTRSTADPSKYSSWTTGKLVFRGDGMSEVARRIERWYNVKVELMDEDLEKYSFRATFEDDSLEEVLKFLGMTSPIRYEITPRQIAGDSIYTKSIIKIYLK
jgi:ferric-dicitrate binding protein FerR (iron transport regulator)